MTILLNLQALKIDPANTKALYRRAQGWQGIKDLDEALVMITVFSFFLIQTFNQNINLFFLSFKADLKKAHEIAPEDKGKIKLAVYNFFFPQETKKKEKPPGQHLVGNHSSVMPKMPTSDSLNTDVFSTEPTELENLFLYSSDASVELGNCLCRSALCPVSQGSY